MEEETSDLEGIYRHSLNIQVQDWEKQGPAGFEGQQERHMPLKDVSEWKGC